MTEHRDCPHCGEKNTVSFRPADRKAPFGYNPEVCHCSLCGISLSGDAQREDLWKDFIRIQDTSGYLVAWRLDFRPLTESKYETQIVIGKGQLIRLLLELSENEDIQIFELPRAPVIDIRQGIQAYLQRKNT